MLHRHRRADLHWERSDWLWFAVFLVVVLVMVSLTAHAAQVPTGNAIPAADFDLEDLKVEVAAQKSRAERAEALNRYLTTQMRFYKARSEALQVIIDGMVDCSNAGYFPGFSTDPRTENYPTCTPRPAKKGN